MRVLTILIAFSLAAFGQRHTIKEVDTEKPDGKMLQEIMQSGDAAQKTALLEKFVEQFPRIDATPWAYEQLLAAYVAAGQPDKILAAGEKLLAIDPDETEAALQCLKASEVKKDTEGIKKYSGMTSALCKKMLANPKPSDEELVENWKLEQNYAKQVDQYAEYSIYRAFAESRDPKVTIEFGELLPQRYPESQYLKQLDDTLFLAYRQAGQIDKAIALGEKAVAAHTTNEDVYLVLTDAYLQAKKEPEKVHAYCARMVEIMNTKPKPANVADDAWAARKNLVISQAYYMNGKLYFNENKFAQADKELVAALPLLESTPAAKSEVLFLLAFSAYKMEKPQDAANYYKACAALKGDYQARAAKNLTALKAQYSGIK